MNKQKGIGFYLFTAVLLVAMLFINFKFFKGNSSTTKRILVVPGQEIKAGDLLVEMENNLLEMEITKLQSKIAALKKEKEERATLVKSKIDYLQAEGGIQVEELLSEIQQINSELDLNRKLTDQFSTATAHNPDITHEVSPEKLRITSLQGKSSLHHQATSIKIKELVKDNAAELLVLENEINLQKQELELLRSEKNKLNKYASYSGVVEDVFVKPGEQIEDFVPIISINPIHPSSIVGYMVGARSRQIPVGAKVAVTSYERKNITTSGEIIGYGAVIALPELLQKSTAVKAFGRQVFIKIPEKNQFATGEKVLIK
jgi:multidrug resistance efflux pump